MRLILTNQHLGLGDDANAPDDTFVFHCFEDFSVGPINDWKDPQLFERARKELWTKVEMRDFPDGEEVDYFVWHRIFPRYNIMELAAGDEFEFPEAFEVNNLMVKADVIEIWADMTVNDRVWQWYIMAELHRMGVNLSRIFLCQFEEDLFTDRKPSFWNGMLCNTHDRDVAAVPMSRADWKYMLKYWTAVANLPTPVDSTLLQSADAETRRTFDIMSGGYPNAKTGLTNLQTRLLRAAKPRWLKMVRIIADAMGDGWAESDRVGDRQLQTELAELAHMETPLVAIKGTGTMRYCEVMLTPKGEELQKQLFGVH